MEKQANIQYTIRGVPPELDRALRQRAARRKLSLNQVIIEELSAAIIGEKRKVDFSDVVGRWIPDPVFDEIVVSQRWIDSDKWK